MARQTLTDWLTDDMRRNARMIAFLGAKIRRDHKESARLREEIRADAAGE